MKTRATAALILSAVLACLSGCNPQVQNVYVYVDNTSDVPIDVIVDDLPSITIQPGSFEPLKIVTGEHTFLIRSDGNEIYRAKQKLEPSQKFLVMRKYLLNPDRQQKYAHVVVRYGTNLQDLINNVAYTVNDDEFVLANEFRLLKKDVKIIDSGQWLDIPPSAIVLEPPPESVSTAGTSATRDVLIRIPKDEYDWMENLLAAETATVDDFQRLCEMTNQF